MPINTVLGAVTPDWTGPVDAHSHVWISPIPGADPGSPVLDDPARILSEVRAYGAAGGALLVDCQPGDCGRDGRQLAWLSGESGVPIVASTGFHRRRYYAPESAVWARDEESWTRHLLAELNPAQGLEECRAGSSFAAGFIKVALEATWAETPTVALSGAARAAAATGVLVQIHTEQGALAEDVVGFFAERGVAPCRLLICHVDKRPDHGLHRELAESGAHLEYDTFFRPKYEPERNLWPLIDAMVAGGFGSALALATDLAFSAQWQAFGGEPGLAAFPATIRQRLTERGLAAEAVALMTGGTITRLLAG